MKLPHVNSPTISDMRRAFLFYPPTLTPPSSSSSFSTSSAQTPTSSDSSSSSPKSPSTSFYPATNLFLDSFSSPIDIPPLLTTEYFDVRLSNKGGYGAFASKDIKKNTVIMTEKPLFRSTFPDVFIELEKLKRKERREYRTLHGFKGISPVLDIAIFKTNRLVIGII